jgi:tRNA dimethylallyltransferase
LINLGIIGPTASGKTTLAVEVAKRCNGEIISADSRQIYKGMDIGTGKDLEEYGNVPYHLINIANAGEKYDVFHYQQDFDKAYKDIVNRGKTPVLCGGSGLYIEAATGEINYCPVPENKQLRETLATYSDEELGKTLAEEISLHNHTDTETRERCIRAIEIARFKKDNLTVKRTPPPYKLFTIDFTPEVLRERIEKRLNERLNNGMIDEVENLLSSGVSAETLKYYGLEYRYITEYLTMKQDKQEMITRLRFAINQFAKRQRTWIRGMERRGYKINHIDGTLPLAEQVAACQPC